MELNSTLDEDAFCRDGEGPVAKLSQLERMVRSAAATDDRTVDAVLKEILVEWENTYMPIAELEVTIGALLHILGAAQNTSLNINRGLFAAILERVCILYIETRYCINV